MKVQVNKTNKGFTLIEMIGVLAVIAILAALLIPKVFNAINEAKVNTVPVGVGTIKAAAIEHYAKWGALNVLGKPDGATPPNPTTTLTVPATGYLNWDDTVLLAEGFIEKPFAPKVGATADIRLIACGAAADDVDGAGVQYDLDGSGSTDNDAAGTHVLEAVLEDVAVKDAQDISMRIDGIQMSQPSDPAAADLEGRVIYAAAGTGTTVDVYIYITHR